MVRASVNGIMSNITFLFSDYVYRFEMYYLSIGLIVLNLPKKSSSFVPMGSQVSKPKTRKSLQINFLQAFLFLRASQNLHFFAMCW